MRHKKSKQPSSPARPSQSRGGTILGVFIGMILGAAIVAVAVWFFNRNDNPFSQSPSSKQAAGTDQAAPQQKAPVPVASLPGKPGDSLVEKPKYEFFNALPNGENVPVTPVETPHTASAKSSSGGATATTTPQQVSLATPRPAPAPAKQMYLQLAAFENAEQADDLKAQLLLMGLDPVTQRAQLADGRVVHRVRVGPFTDREDLKAMRARLVSNGFSAEEVSNN